MFYLREEGQALHNGFNFYRLSDKSSSGFIFRLGTKSFMLRYSKIKNTWFIG
jgi:hypothetical protein